MDTVLALLDFSDVTAAVLKVGNDLARAFHDKVVLMHVAAAPADFAADEAGAETPAGEATGGAGRREHALRVLEKECRAIGVEAASLVVPAHSSRGGLARTILREIERLRPAWVVVGSHGHGALYELMLGSVSTAVVRHAACPVVVVPGRPAGRT